MVVVFLADFQKISREGALPLDPVVVFVIRHSSFVISS
jgi:hypothetical protein